MLHAFAGMCASGRCLTQPSNDSHVCLCALCVQEEDPQATGSSSREAQAEAEVKAEASRRRRWGSTHGRCRGRSGGSGTSRRGGGTCVGHGIQLCGSHSAPVYHGTHSRSGTRAAARRKGKPSYFLVPPKRKPHVHVQIRVDGWGNAGGAAPAQQQRAGSLTLATSAAAHAAFATYATLRCCTHLARTCRCRGACPRCWPAWAAARGPTRSQAAPAPAGTGHQAPANERRKHVEAAHAAGAPGRSRAHRG